MLRFNLHVLLIGPRRPAVEPANRVERRFASLIGMYHVELRQFPHNFCHFNLTEQALRATVLDGWARGEWVEVGERKWNSQQANLTVLEGPELPVEQLSMGRGWRNAVRQGTDVTADVLARARSRLGAAEQGSTPAEADTAPAGTARSAWAAIVGPAQGGAAGRMPASAAGPSPASAAMGGTVEPTAPQPVSGSEVPGRPPAEDDYARQLLSLLGEDPGALLRAWLLALERHPERTPSQCLALAEDFVRR
jgi:hypothetical protein